MKKTNPNKNPFVYATRDEVNCKLEVIEGNLPNDLYGHLFINSPCGSVNSGGLPYPKHYPGSNEINKEYGTNVFNGDAMLFRFDLNEKGKISLQTGLLKTPCYYADEATKRGTELHKKHMGFQSYGISRISHHFGSRNQLNTAVTPFRLKGDEYSRLTANFDMGRPWEVDVQSLKVKTPIGYYRKWVPEFPKVFPYPFQTIQASAHPAFDPLTHEFFAVNFTKTFFTMFFYEKFSKRMVTHRKKIHEKLTTHLQKIKEEDHPDKIAAVNDFYKNIDDHIYERNTIWDKILHFFRKVSSLFVMIFFIVGDWIYGKKNGTFILRWKDNEVQRWKIVDAKTGKPVIIDQCMHQNNLSKDYLVLSDAAFKFSADILLTNPFPHDQKMDRFLRELTAIPQMPETPLYIIKRSDLNANSTTVKAHKIVIDLELVHFSMNYENPNGKITLHTAHNAAACAAEWIRPYDELVLEREEGIYENTIGLMAYGEMDIGRIGKFLVDAEKGEIIKREKIYLTGSEGGAENKGAHTWGIALHTFRDIISSTKVVDEVKQVYWQSYGTDPRFLTKFIEGLYQDYEHRIIPVAELIEKNREKVPFCLLRQDTSTMSVPDFYLFQFNENLRSLQFIPRDRRGQDTTDIDLSMDGYIFCTMVNGTDDLNLDEYTREVWIFDAADLKTGPICKLSHPDMNYAFTIHSTWMENCKSQVSPYQVNIREDYQYSINRYAFKKRAFYSDFMEKYVYPHFDS